MIAALPPIIERALSRLPPLLSADGVLVYGVGAVLALIGLANLLQWYRRRTREPIDLAEFLDRETVSQGRRVGAEFDDLAEHHQAAIAPAAVDWETRAARVGDQWTTTLYVAGYPDAPLDGYLSDLYELTDVAVDVTAHLTPTNQHRARDDLQNVADDLQADANLERTVRGSYLQERATRAAATYRAVESGQRVVDQSLFVTVRADTRDELRDAVSTVQATLRDRPAGLDPKPAVCLQDRALRSAAPVGGDALGREAVALGGAVGALLASPHRATVLEAGGVEFGTHTDTNSPVVVDPFAREDGYAMFTVGDPGSGKSFGAKQNFIRTLQQDPDRIGIVLEPLNDWNGIVEALGGRHITVGGTLGLNPLEIRPTPEHVLRARGADASPLKERLTRAIGFFENYFTHRNVALGDRRTTLEVAFDEAYERQGITEDVTTHDNPSPTVRDVLDILGELRDEPEQFVVRSAAETTKLAEDAVWLLDQLRPFAEGGQFANLGRESEFDIRDEKVLYLDLAQQGGSLGGQTSLLMELLITLVYERAKETEKEVVFVIDEARYLMADDATLAYLETIFRHHRHHDLSIRLVTQTVDEFFEHDVAKMILDQCAIKQFHKLEGMNEHWATEFGLNHAQMRYVQDAIPGNEETGYSEALLGIDGAWRGIEISALPAESTIIDYEAGRRSQVMPESVGDAESAIGDDD